MYILFEKLK